MSNIRDFIDEHGSKLLLMGIILIVIIITIIFSIQQEKDFADLIKQQGCKEAGIEYGRSKTGAARDINGNYHMVTITEPNKVIYKCNDGKTIIR